ncbi:hypothetical protein RUM43_013454 [Polyplax serrata]|uniref:Uncharacterized protein n=1 Tax=Polyplax serrata TaxID=468196 RepID=A0AAN8S6C5_POLSC
MSKLNEEAVVPREVTNSSAEEVEEFESTEADNGDKDERMENQEDKSEILKLTMLINKYNLDLETTTNRRIGDDPDRYKRNVKCAMFFNKEVTIRPTAELSPSAPPSSPVSIPGQDELNEPANSSTEVTSFSVPLSDPYEVVGSENCRTANITPKRSQKIKNETVRPVDHPDLRSHSSLTSLSRPAKSGLEGAVKTKYQSMTSLDTASDNPPENKFTGWKDLTDFLALAHADFPKEKYHNLQMSKSTNENNEMNINGRSVMRFRKGDEVMSASDSRLLHAVPDNRGPIKKCDKKSRGDSYKKESTTDVNTAAGRKQVQWKTEVDVIYFSTHLGANGDRTGEVIERVIEPLREEWEQQRKGFYAKIVPYHIASHLTDHFISLLKI